jgi:hypothetical protein
MSRGDPTQVGRGPVGQDRVGGGQADRLLLAIAERVQMRVVQMSAVLVRAVQIQAVLANSARNRSLAQASRIRMPNPSRVIVRGARRFARQVKAAIGVVRRREVVLRPSRSGPGQKKGAGRMPKASGPAVREPAGSRVLIGLAGKAWDSTSQDLISPATTRRNQVGQHREALERRHATTAPAPTGRGQRVQTANSNVHSLHGETHRGPAVRGRPANRSGPVVRVTRVRHSGLARDQHLAHGQQRDRDRQLVLARGHHMVLVRDLLLAAHPAEAVEAVRVHRRVDLASRAKRRPGSRTEAERAAVGAPAVRDAHNTTNMRVTQGFGSVARMNSAK